MEINREEAHIILYNFNVAYDEGIGHGDSGPIVKRIMATWPDLSEETDIGLVLSVDG